MRTSTFFLVALGVAAVLFGIARLFGGEYLFFAGYTVLQFVVLATAWNILGGYCGYVNFGSAAFFALGAYSTVVLHKLMPMPIPVLIVVGGIVSGIVGLGVGYLTLRLRGVFFAIATLALAIVLQTLILNWDFVGGSRGAYVIRPNEVPILGSYVQYLFLLMLLLAVVAITAARMIERSRLGYGFTTIRDDELAAEACGVPTLKLKLIATTLSGAFMGMAGAPFPYYIGYLEPASAFGLQYAVNSIAMPMIGGTTSWVGPLVGAVLLGSVQQYATVTISSSVNLLIVGLLLVGFVIIAPKGIVGLAQDFMRVAAPAGPDLRSAALIAIAIYAFVVGILGIVESLAVMSANVGKTAFYLGLLVLAVSVFCAVAAYGLLTLQAWAPRLAAALFAISVVAAGVQLWLSYRPYGTVLPVLASVLSIVIVWRLLRPDVRVLYERAGQGGVKL